MEVRTSRVKAGGVALLCAALVGLFWWLAQTESLAWIGVAAFGLGVLAAGKQLLKPTTMLRLEDNALIIPGGVRPRSPVPWNQVERVEVREGGALRPSHVVVYVDDRSGRSVDFSDMWLDTDAKTLGEAIADRAGRASDRGRS